MFLRTKFVTFYHRSLEVSRKIHPKQGNVIFFEIIFNIFGVNGWKVCEKIVY